MKDEYPDSKSDLFAAFIERCAGLALPRGAAAMITMQSWMFLSSYEKLRASLLTHQQITSMLHLGARAFDSISGEVVASTAFVLNSRPAGNRGAVTAGKGVFVRLVEGSSEAEKIASLHAALAVRDVGSGFHLASDEDFAAIPGSPIVYWLSEKMRAAFTDAQPLRDVVRLREGINTGDNQQFLRRWWEVSRLRTSFARRQMGEPSEKWVPHRKGGAFRKWAGNSEYVVNWGSSGEQIHEYHRIPIDTNGAPMRGKSGFFLPCLSWSRISSGDFSVRRYSAGYSYDSTSPSVFGSNEDISRAESLLNSSIVAALMLAMSPTLDYRLTALGNLPLPAEWSTHTAIHAREATTAAMSDWDSAETSWGFDRNPLIARANVLP